MDAWNTHRIRSAVNNDNGIPDELYFLPEISGKISKIIITKFVVDLGYNLLGHEDHSCDYDGLDVQLCQQMACDKPEPTIPEFTDLAKIVMEEENIDTPTTPQEALALYIDLVENITQ